MRILINGTVQGVGFRPTVYRIAKLLGINGYVLNKGSNVEIIVDKKPDEFLKVLKREIPDNASIDEIILKEEKGEYRDFVILESSEGIKSSLPPPDTVTCDECLREIFDKNNRRYLYPFTNCTNCGARFSLIKDVPYDREKTSMTEFKLCEDCLREYRDPLDRRFHAQTISCPKCGPKYKFYDENKNAVDHGPIKTFAESIDDGAIGIMKSWGGMHLVCNLDEIERFRRWYNREAKPFAIMLRDLGTAREYVTINEYEEAFLRSPQRPVVLLNKSHNNEVLEGISPGLGNVGVYLPYTGLHHLLFHYLKSDGVIMTSANLPGEPMITRNEDAFNLKVGAYLLHNRRIINRIDDSVIRSYNDKKFFLRRSRSFVPHKIKVPYGKNIISVGAEENVSVSVSTDGKLYITQYIGNTRYYPTTEFLTSATDRLIDLLDVEEVNAIGIDSHPRYITRRFGMDLVERFHSRLFEVQHHWAHAVSLMVDNEIEEPIIALTLDGAGYGTDGSIWGGEILRSSLDSFERIGHLDPIPLIGGDAATKDPRRIVFAIFEMLGKDLDYFEEKETYILRNLMEKSPITSSFGRVLDALSCYLDIGVKRTYDGEPAMKLERYLNAGELTHEFETEVVDHKIVRTLPLFDQLTGCSHESEKEKADLVYSFVYALLEKMTGIAICNAEENDIEYIGITGGVSYNVPIVKIVEKLIKDGGLEFLTHNQIPNGDGGISIGQNAVVGVRLER
jgi:hydrogenase maturation protein HypF